MSNAPILVLQMQRLGDLVLTFPLLGWLGTMFPGHPLWVVGEEMFYRHLMPLSPDAVYFSYDTAHRLKTVQYRAVINLSHREEALQLAGSLATDLLLGPYRDASGKKLINGAWQLYRASITHNNRHNLFHWADLNALDLLPPTLLAQTCWPQPRAFSPQTSGHIGLFLGASQPDKQPETPFWVKLCHRLMHAGHKPVLLGGEAERALGAHIARQINAPSLDLCGRFSITELVDFTRNLDLLVTPDTGPMHVAAWTSTPTLNLSMGPVNAWETGPSSPGHLVVRARLSCVGCWQCTQPGVLCKASLSPSAVARVINQYLLHGGPGLHSLSLPGLELLRTERDRFGLYALMLCTADADSRPRFRQLTAELWQAFFGCAFTTLPESVLHERWASFAAQSPALVPCFITSLARLSTQLAVGLRTPGTGAVSTSAFWSGFPPLMRPLSSYIGLLLQNRLFHKSAFAESLTLIEKLAALTADSR